MTSTTTPTPTDSGKTALKIAKTADTPRTVTVSHAEAHDGRLPVTVTVVPVEDFDAHGGVFVDFRKGAKSEVEAETQPLAGERSVASIKQGDAAVAALAAKEVEAGKPLHSASPAKPPLPPEPAAPPSTAKAAPAIDADDVTQVIAAVSDDREPKHNKQPIVSHQIAQPQKLTVGQAETFRADVGFHEPAEGEVWFVRGRFAGDKDLSSAWLRI